VWGARSRADITDPGALVPGLKHHPETGAEYLLPQGRLAHEFIIRTYVLPVKHSIL
jgi:hypothetical protein